MDAVGLDLFMFLFTSCNACKHALYSTSTSTAHSN